MKIPFYKMEHVLQIVMPDSMNHLTMVNANLVINTVQPVIVNQLPIVNLVKMVIT